jgi:6-phosphogluconolactonase/glucosamine-6-phosphate isomerase/deaminase
MAYSPLLPTKMDYRVICVQENDSFVNQSVHWLKSKIQAAIAKDGVCILGLSGGMKLNINFPSSSL